METIENETDAPMSLAQGRMGDVTFDLVREGTKFHIAVAQDQPGAVVVDARLAATLSSDITEAEAIGLFLGLCMMQLDSLTDEAANTMVADMQTENPEATLDNVMAELGLGFVDGI
jgi:hypothetical protein